MGNGPPVCLVALTVCPRQAARLSVMRRQPARPADGMAAVLAAARAAAAAANVDHAVPVPDPTAGAFFDVDNTIMRGASIYHFARGLAARKMFGPADLARMTWAQL